MKIVPPLQEYGKYQPNVHTVPYSYHGLDTKYFIYFSGIPKCVLSKKFFFIQVHGEEDCAGKLQEPLPKSMKTEKLVYIYAK